MIKSSSSLQENEIHMADGPFNKDLKNIFFEGVPNFGGGTTRKFREIGNKRDINCYANWGGQFQKRILAPTCWYQNPCDASTFLHARPSFRGKVKKLNFQVKI